MGRQTKLTYSSVTSKQSSCVINEVPNMVFEHGHNCDEQTHYVYYRPALLNDRHLVDVMRTVLGPADVDEAELDRVRREVTEEAADISEDEGVWVTSWEGAAVTVEP